MPLAFDFDRMEELLQCFSNISGVRYSLMDKAGTIICHSNDFAPFCVAMNASQEGHARCRQCDAQAIQKTAAQGGPQIYHCHAGLVEAVIPVLQHGEPLAYIFFGQMRDAGPLEDCWQRTRNRLDWMDDPNALREPFMALKPMNHDVVESCSKILEACSAYIWMEGVIRSAFMSDEQLLNQYISEHYAETLTLDGIASALSMSKTKLCSIASKLGTTVMKMVNVKRMEEAKRILRHSDDRINEIASMVGLRDFNYFTKQFKAYCGETPRAYQKRHRKSSGIQ